MLIWGNFNYFILLYFIFCWLFRSFLTAKHLVCRRSFSVGIVWLYSGQPACPLTCPWPLNSPSISLHLPFLSFLLPSQWSPHLHNLKPHLSLQWPLNHTCSKVKCRKTFQMFDCCVCVCVCVWCVCVCVLVIFEIRFPYSTQVHCIVGYSNYTHAAEFVMLFNEQAPELSRCLCKTPFNWVKVRQRTCCLCLRHASSQQKKKGESLSQSLKLSLALCKPHC